MNHNENGKNDENKRSEPLLHQMRGHMIVACFRYSNLKYPKIHC